MVSDVTSRKKEIERKISLLEKEANDLRNELDLIRKEEKEFLYKEMIGKCYKINRNTYFKVKEIPGSICAKGLIVICNPDSSYIHIENNEYEDLSALHNEVSEKEFFKIMDDAISYCE